MKNPFSNKLEIHKVSAIITSKTYYFFGIPFKLKIVSTDVIETEKI